MKKYWRIVPTDTSYKYIGIKDGEYILFSKMETTLDTSLVFKHKKNCQKYLEENFDNDKYKVEEIYLNARYYKVQFKDE